MLVFYWYNFRTRSKKAGELLWKPNNLAYSSFSYNHYVNVNASEQELRESFALICADVFGYSAGGTGQGWNVCAIGLNNLQR